MKKALLLTIGLILISTLAMASLEIIAVQQTLIKQVVGLKNKASSDKARYVTYRQKIQDYLSTQASNIDDADETKLNALVTKIQDIETTLTALETAIGNNLSAVE